MTSLLDLDQGGTFRPRQNIWMGNSIGWVFAPEAITRVTTGGTIQIRLGVRIIAVGSALLTVTIQLPAFKGSTTASQGAVPGPFVPVPITVIDTGGTAGTTPITILPAAGETISGLSSITITTNFGAVVLQPDPVNGGCTVVS